MALVLVAASGLPGPATAADPIIPTIGFETCTVGSAVSSITCAGIATISTANGSPTTVSLDGMLGSVGDKALMSDDGPITITFSADTVSASVTIVGAGVDARIDAYSATDTLLAGNLASGGTASVSAAGIRRVVISNPAGPFGIDQLVAEPATALAGCPAYEDGCAVDVCTVPFRVGGTVSGLPDGEELSLTLNADETKTIGANGIYRFDTELGHDRPYAVTISASPSGQSCIVSNGTGTIDDEDISNADVTCGTLYTVGGTLSGLAGGSSVSLTNNGGDTLTLSANGAFTFPTSLLDLGDYSVTVSAQPTSPMQVCSVSNGSGTLAGANVTNVAITRAPSHPTITPTISGPAPGASVSLTNNGGDTLTLSANGAFTFPTSLLDLGDYSVTVSAQPTSPAQVCSVGNGSGTLAGANVTNVAITCVTSTFTIGGTVSGLAPGASVSLTNNGGDTLTLSANGAFTFPTALADLGTYAVAVSAQPTSPVQVCSVGNDSGTLAGADVTNVAVSCVTSTFTVGGTVSGLAPGASVSLTNNGGDTLTLSANGAFTFPTALADLGTYAVAVSAQPTSPVQVCSVGNDSGTLAGADVTNVAVSCVTSTFTVGGTVSGLAPGASVSLTNNGGDTLTLSANGAFTFPTALADLGTYAVAVSAQPTSPTQVCSVSNGSGTLAGANVTNVAITCVTSTFTVGGSVSGLAPGASVSLTNNGGDTLTLSANGAFTFPTSLLDLGDYSVTVSAQPTSPTQVCSVGNGSGTLSGADVTNVAVTCATSTFKIGGSVSGLAPGASVSLTNNGGDPLTLSADGAFTFPTALPDLGTYAVVVSAQPTSPAQVCTVDNGTGTLAGANINNVGVSCANSSYTVTPIAGTGGTLDPATPQTVAEGSTRTFTVHADPNYRIDSVTGCAGTLSGTQYVTGPVSADCQVTATFALTTISGPTTGGTATVTVTDPDWTVEPIGTGPQDSAGFIPVQGHPDSPTTPPPDDVQFPTGLVDLQFAGGAPGSPITVTLQLPQPPPNGAQLWVFGPTVANGTPHWHTIPFTVSGTTVTFTLIDGGAGDADLQADGRITFVGGIGFAALASAPALIPSANLYGLAALLLLLAMAGMRAAGNRRARS